MYPGGYNTQITEMKNIQKAHLKYIIAEATII